jgi:hypothetical protein
MIVLMRSTAMKIHGKMFGLSEEVLSKEYFRYLANYKIAIYIFNLVPYLALRIVISYLARASRASLLRIRPHRRLSHASEQYHSRLDLFVREPCRASF